MAAAGLKTPQLVARACVQREEINPSGSPVNTRSPAVASIDASNAYL